MDNLEKIQGIIERGTIIAQEGNGYIIASIDRDGIKTPPLEPTDNNNSFSEGDRVYYFIFNDGTGRIICKF